MSKVNYTACKAIEKGRKEDKSCRKIGQGISLSITSYLLKTLSIPE